MHGAELARVEESLASFRAAAPTALELARERVGPVPQSAPDPAVLEALEDVTAPGRPPGSRWIRRVVANWDRQEPFGPTDVAGEVNRRYRLQLRRPVNTRAASNVLRRMHAEGRIPSSVRAKPSARPCYLRRGEPGLDIPRPKRAASCPGRPGR